MIDQVKNKSAELLFAVYLMSFPFSIKYSNGILILCLLSFIFNANYRNIDLSWGNNKLIYSFILFFTVNILSLFYTENLNAGLHNVELYSVFIFVPLLFVLGKSFNFEFSKSIKFFVYGCFMALLICFIYALYRNWIEGYTPIYVLKALLGEENGRKFYMYEYFNYWYFSYKLFSDGIKLQPIYFASFLNLSILILLDKVRLGMDLRKSLLKPILLIIFFVLGIVLLSSRTQLFITIIIISIYMFNIFYRNKVSIVFKVALPLLILFSVSVVYYNPVLNERFMQVFKKDESNSNWGGKSIRLKKWESSLELISNNLLLGVGTGDVVDELLEIYERDNFEVGVLHKYNPHNQYLHAWLNGGVFAVLTLFLIFYYFIIDIDQNKIFNIVLVLIFSISFITESMLERQKGALAFVFFLLYYNYLKNGQCRQRV